MRRKIVQQGPATLMVSLPAKWVKKNNLKKGQEMDVEEDGSRLIMQSEGKARTETLEINLKSAKTFPSRVIHVPYKQGYDELKIRFSDPAAMREIELKVEQLMGFEIVDQKQNSCTIKSFTVVEDNDFDKILRRIFLLILNMAKESYESLNKGELDRLRSIGDIERTVEKFSQFSIRLINKNNSLKPRETTFHFASVWSLEQTSDAFAMFCNQVGDNKLKLRKETIELYQKIIKLYEEFYNLYYTPNIEASDRFKQKLKKTRKAAFALINSKEGEAINYMINIIDRINELSYFFS